MLRNAAVRENDSGGLKRANPGPNQATFQPPTGLKVEI
jgi:hypothetical protein